jgi:hypothetical protein
MGWACPGGGQSAVMKFSGVRNEELFKSLGKYFCPAIYLRAYLLLTS